MNRLWVRLSLVFTAVVLLGFGAVVFGTISLTSNQRLQSLLLNQFERPRGLVDSAEDYYEEHGSWAGVETLMDGARATLLPGNGGRGVLLLLDAEGAVVYSSVPSARIPARFNRSGQPIVVDDRIVGQIDFLTAPGNRSFPWAWNFTPPSDFLEDVFLFLVRIALAVGLLGLAFGVLASRNLTAPLSRLAAGAKAIGARNLDYRVPVQGSEEIREVARSFNEMATALQSAESLRRNLLADVAHELRTPLTVLQGNLQAILDDVYPLDKSEVARLYDQTHHLHRLVNDLHELAQAEAHQLPLHRQTVDPGRLAQEAVELFGPVAEEKGIRLVLEAGSDLSAIQGDRARLMQVLQNLLNNALRHTPAGGQIRLSVNARQTGTESSVEITVADSGEGIAAEDLPHIFDRFYRAGRARDRDSGGTGLGLAIVRALVEAHNGQVEATSPGRGKGSRFVIRIGAGESSSLPG